MKSIRRICRGEIHVCGPAQLNEASGGGESDQAVRSEVEFSCEGSASKAIREEVGLATCESGV